jgi:hypothetical protein
LYLRGAEDESERNQRQMMLDQPPDELRGRRARRPRRETQATFAAIEAEDQELTGR